MLVKNHILLFMLRDQPLSYYLPMSVLLPLSSSTHLLNNQYIFIHNRNMAIVTLRISSEILLDNGNVFLSVQQSTFWQLREGL